jgi:hypothetical protein
MFIPNGDMGVSTPIILLKNNSIFKGNPLFLVIRFIFFGAGRGTPPSPPKGEASQGKHPFDPLFFGVFHQLYTGNRNNGGLSGGGGLKDDVNFFLIHAEL